ncbi:hypothetical protein [Lichenicoccus sp.]|uniref:hypothetical protein n=1 Tax=Lichenicoccus sp. TaxID=2781899 RepID=UPI003D0CB50B
MRASWLLLSLLMLADCASKPVPFRIDHAGTLPQASYADFDRQAAAATPRLKTFGAVPKDLPEPYWVFSFEAPLDPGRAPLQIGRFSGSGEIAARVAANLPQHLQQALSGTGLFKVVTRSPMPHAFVLCGTVTRADEENGPGLETNDGTQVEAILVRDNAFFGAIQINAIELGFSPLSLGATLIMNLAQGSRASFVSGKFAEVFQAAAKGSRRGLSTDSLSTRFMRMPAAPSPVRQAAATPLP